MRKLSIISLLVAIYSCCFAAAQASLVTYNSPTTDQNDATRAKWLAATGITAPQYRVDFETGFSDGQNVSNQVGLFPGRMLVRDTSTQNQAVIESGPGSIALSNPVGNFALTWDGSLFDYLELDFSGAPVDYVGWQDIDTTSNNSRISIYFTDGTYQNFYPDATYETGNSAEFLGFFRNDLPQIKKVRLNLSGDLYGIDNIEYGNLPAAAILPGDFNNDGTTDAADYISWRKDISSADPAAGLNRAANDYDIWRAHFDESVDSQQIAGKSLSSTGFATRAVPEPTTLSLLMFAAAAVLFAQQRSSKRR